MKKNILYIFALYCLVMAMTSCEKRDPEFFDEDANGAYFDYEYASDFDKTLNFGDYIVNNPDTVTITLRVKLLGYVMERERTLSVKTRALEGYELADVIIDEVTFANNVYEKNIDVRVCRPHAEDVLYGVCIYLDGSGDIGTAIKGKDEINLYVTETYEMPVVWYSHMETLLGAWNKAKHRYLAEHTGRNHYYSDLYDDDLGMHLYDSILNLNVSAVNALLAHAPTTPITADLPILQESERPAYTKPYFWDNYIEELGVFRANKFCRFTTMLGGSNTKDIASLYASEAGRLKMSEEAEGFHKSDVQEMLNEYYNYAMENRPLSEYKESFWVRMKNSVNYTMRIPYWWEDPQCHGVGDIIKMYYGDYEAEKYQFMLKTIMKEDGEDSFIAASLFPFLYDKEQNTWGWDESSFGTGMLTGEARFKACYRIIKAANNKRPPSKRYSIPDVPL